MIQIIQFYQGSFCVASGPRALWSPGEGQRSIEFYLGECSTIPELHRGELMNFIKAIDTERSAQILDLILELFNTHPRVGRIDLDLFHAACERLQLSGTPDVSIEFTCAAIKGAGSEEYVSLRLRKRRPD